MGEAYERLLRAQQARQRQEAQSSKFGDADPEIPAVTVETRSQNHIPVIASKVKPLLDLRPQYQELPQHRRIDKAVTLQQGSSTALMEVAKNPDLISHASPNNGSVNVPLSATAKSIQRKAKSDDTKQRLSSLEPQLPRLGNDNHLGGVRQRCSPPQSRCAIRNESRQAGQALLRFDEQVPWKEGSLLDQIR